MNFCASKKELARLLVPMRLASWASHLDAIDQNFAKRKICIEAKIKLEIAKKGLLG